MKRVLLLLSFVAACRGVPFPEYEPASDDAAFRRLRTLYPVPRAVMTTQRWILRSRGSEFFFTLYVGATPPHELRMAAVSDLGTTLAEATSDENGTVVVQESRAMNARMIEDLLLLLRARFLGPAAGAALARLSDGRTALHAGHALYSKDIIHVGRNGSLAGTITIDSPAVFKVKSLAHSYTALATIVDREAE